MRAIGIIRVDLAAAPYTRERLQGMLERTAARDGHELTETFDYDIADPDATEKMLAAIQGAGTEQVIAYAPYRAHLNGTESLILEHACLELVLDNLGWSREVANP